ncbi:MAG: TnsA endonuclease N-terminal domain-containing protein [Candidatus Pacebacteria bacterium]|jgi:hypothetical protein|nr:TnsA endonuclease N-terminal domain-containing protein [Candidatus Paceibacterota bacterium]
MSYKGKYKVKNREKYVGAVDNVQYRSSWERRFMVYCDVTQSKIVRWSSEELILPYRSPVDGKIHRYFPDFWIEQRSEDGRLSTMVIEVKPKKECGPPNPPKTKNSRSKYKYLSELKTWKVNEAKWKVAEEFCRDRKWQFKLLTEDHLVK